MTDVFMLRNPAECQIKGAPVETIALKITGDKETLTLTPIARGGKCAECSITLPLELFNSTFWEKLQARKLSFEH